MIKSKLFPDKIFSDKKEMLADIKANLKDIIDLKKSEVQKSCEKENSISCRAIDVSKFSEKNKSINLDQNYWYVAVNSTYVLDSHNDLHVDGIWDKTANEQQRKNYLVCDHKLLIDNVVVRKEHVELLLMNLPFKVIGKNYEGITTVLVYKFPKNKVVHQKAKEWLESGDEIQASVRMQYVNVEFAADSDLPEDAEYKSIYNQYINKIANKEEFEEIPYFFVIKEAKNIKESSLVLYGSNNSTGLLDKNIQPQKSTENNTRAADRTQKMLKELENLQKIIKN